MKINQEWWKESVVYQIYPQSFNDSNGDGIGDINGIIGKLDYLKELGVDVLWLSPIYDSPQEDNGYDIRDYLNIYEKYGEMKDFDNLLNEVHRRDMKLIMDLVVNHTSDEHEWFMEAKKDKNNRYRDFYIWKDGVDGNEPPNNWGSIFGGPAWELDGNTNQYYLHLFATKQPDLNWENEDLRNQVYKIINYWLDKGIDGFRMDVINFISKNLNFPNGKVVEHSKFGDAGEFFVNGPKIHKYLKEMNNKVLSRYDIMTVGEMPGATTEYAIDYTDPKNEELNMIFTFEHMNLDQKGNDKWDISLLDLRELKRNFEKWQTSLYQKGWNSLYWNNHDQPRIVSRFGNDKKYREKSAKMLGLCLHLMQGTPYIFQGEEIGMTNVKFDVLDQYRDIELFNMYDDKKSDGWSHEKIMESIYKKGRDSARTSMQWSDEKNAGFTDGTPWINVNPNYKSINAEKAKKDKNSIFHFYRELINLRKDNQTVIDGRFELILPDSQDIFSYIRHGDGEKLIVICNFSDKEVTLPKDELVDILTSAELLISNEENPSKYKLQPYAANLWRVTNK
ncbi:glycoside hydrolase family 13 protein [Salipaludibacillus sp. CF4.18]|uniref:glycoside hydrolase family 13 protein n=1 Tax=Salipaludibacillus sp. CF4.18 TaxID=3373081 RepID=UPI003EE6F14C